MATMLFAFRIILTVFENSFNWQVWTGKMGIYQGYGKETLVEVVWKSGGLDGEQWLKVWRTNSVKYWKRG